MIEIRKILDVNWRRMAPNTRPIQKPNNRSCILFKMPKHH